MFKLNIKSVVFLHIVLKSEIFWKKIKQESIEYDMLYIFQSTLHT